MSMITCNCGNTYDSGFKFCPECATPNPEYGKKPAATGAKKKFTKVGESSLTKGSSQQKQAAPTVAKTITPKKNYTVVKQNSIPVPKPVQPKPVAKPAEIYEEYEDEDEDELPQDYENAAYEDYDYEDEVEDDTSEAENYEDYEDTEDYEDDVEDDEEDEVEDYEDEVEEEEAEEEIPAAPLKTSLPFKAKSKVLSAPMTKSTRNVVAAKPANVVPKTKSIKQTKSSLGKNKPEYDPNHDGYYDDRLPAILDEVTKASHLDVILKISLSIVCIAALITYCIFYVKV